MSNHNFADLLKVSAKSDPNSVAGAIAGAIRERSEVVVQSIGAGAMNQAIKSVAIANGFVAAGGQEIYVKPIFKTIKIDGEERTAMVLEAVDIKTIIREAVDKAMGRK